MLTLEAPWDPLVEDSTDFYIASWSRHQKFKNAYLRKIPPECARRIPIILGLILVNNK